jgi:hypothetical protein
MKRLAAADTCAQVNKAPQCGRLRVKTTLAPPHTPRLSGQEAPHLMNGHAIGLTGDTTSADGLQLVHAEYAEVL